MNLATLEEEYSPEPDLTVYNPKGPAVVWKRIYNSLRSDSENSASPNSGTATESSTDFGRGWSHPYNVTIVRGATTGSGATLATQYAIVMPNKGRIGFSINNGTIAPSVLPTQAGAPCQVKATAASPVTFEVTWRDGSVWTLSETAAGSAIWRLRRIADVRNNGINFVYTATAPFRLTSITNNTGAATLLTINRANGDANGITSVDDNAGQRSVFYQSGTQGANSFGQLTEVSRIYPLGAAGPYAARYTYNYTNYSAGAVQIPFLTAMWVVSPENNNTGVHASIEYDTNTLVVKKLTDANGNQHVYASAPNGNVTQVAVQTAGGQQQHTYYVSYNPNMAVAGYADAMSRTLRYCSYNDPDNPQQPDQISYDDAKGHTYLYKYDWDKFGNLLSATSPRDIITAYTYVFTVPQFPCGALTEVKRGMRTKAKIYYGAVPDGFPSHLRVDAISPTVPDDNTDTLVQSDYFFDSLGNPTSVKLPNPNRTNTTPANITALAYDSDTWGGNVFMAPVAVGQPLVVTDATSKAWHFRYDNRGNALQTWDSFGNLTEITYNLSNQTTQVILPATGQAAASPGIRRINYNYLYDGGPLISTESFNEAGTSVSLIQYGLGPEGESKSIGGNVPETSNQVYDALYRVTSVKDGANNTTSYSYDTVGNLSRIDYPGGNSVQFTSYDALGRVLKRLDGRGYETLYYYNDPLGNLSTITYPATVPLYPGSTAYPFTTVNYAYDIYGRPTGVNDGWSIRTSNYNSADVVIQTITGLTYTSGYADKTITYTYNYDGSRASMTLPAALGGNGTIAYKYDAAGRPNKVTTPWNETLTYTYDIAGRLTNKDARNGTADTSPVIYKATNGYNAINQLTGHYYANAGGQLIASFGGMIYDGAGNMTAADHYSALAYPGFDGLTTYVYSGTSDGRITGRLLQEASVRHAAGGAGFTSNFLYDATGNVTQRNSGIRPDQNFSGRSYNSANQPNDGVSTFNGNGDQTKTPIFSSLSYDLEGRATQFEYFGNIFRCGYYADGRRAFTTNRNFIYDGNDPVLETNKAGAITAVNVFGPDGLLSRRTGSGSRFYLFDERGNTAMRVNASGTSLSAGVTDAFGFTGYVYSTTTGNEYDPYSGFGAQYGYYFDPETTQTLCGLRYYDPFQARWLTRDPIGQEGGINLYAYVSGNPIMGIDSSGLDAGWARSGQGPYGDQHLVGGKLYDSTDAIIELFGGPKLPASGIGSPVWNEANSSIERGVHAAGLIYAFRAPGGGGRSNAQCRQEDTDLTSGEMSKLQSIADEHGESVYVFGSAARGQRRFVGQYDIPLGKRAFLRSDLDLAVEPHLAGSAMVKALYNEFANDVDPFNGVQVYKPSALTGPIFAVKPKSK